MAQSLAKIMLHLVLGKKNQEEDVTPFQGSNDFANPVTQGGSLGCLFGPFRARARGGEATMFSGSKKETLSAT